MVTGLVPARVSAALTGVAGLWALAASGLTGVGLAVVAAVLAAVGGAASALLQGPQQRTLRRGASGILLAVVGGIVVLATGDGGTGTGSSVTALGPMLGVSVTALLVAHSLVVDRTRDVLVHTAIGLLMCLLAGGLAPGRWLVLPVAVAWPAAVATLVLLDGERQAKGIVLRATPQGSPSPGAAGRAGPVAALVGSGVLCGLLVFLVVPHLSEPVIRPSGASALERLAGDPVQQPGRRGGSAGGADAAAGRRSPAQYVGGAGDMDLDARGRLPDTPVLDVPAEAPAHWRAQVLARYDGRGWRAQSGDDVARRARSGGDGTIAVTYDDEAPPAAVRTWTVRTRAAFDGTVVAPGGALAVSVERGLAVGPGRSLRVAPGAGTYRVVAAASGQGSGGTDVRAVWTELPPSVPDRVRVLGRRLVGQRTGADAVRAVETYLRAHATYRLDSPVPAPGADSVDDFLFRSHEGFCEHFASAEVVLLRAGGIPARVATGWLVSGPDEDGYRLVRASDAHAWVEAFLPGAGWVLSDPTPPGQPASDSVTDRVERSLRSPLVRLLLALVLVLLVGAGVLLRRRLAARRRARPPVRRPRDHGPLLDAFRRLESALHRTGRPREPAESIAEVAWRLRAGEEVDAALDTVQRALYGPRPPSDAEAAVATQTLDRLSTRLLADAANGVARV